MKILALFVLFSTPLWAFKGEEYWNGFQEAYTHGKVRNLYHYLEKLSDLEADVIPEEMSAVAAIDYRADSITYFTVTGGKYGFRSTPATPQEWEQHKKALVFVGSEGLYTETFKSFTEIRKEYTNDYLDTPTKGYLWECQKIYSGAKALVKFYKTYEQYPETGNYEGIRVLYSFYLMEKSFYDESLQNSFSYHKNENGRVMGITPQFTFSPPNWKLIFAEARQIFNPTLRALTFSSLCKSLDMIYSPSNDNDLIMKGIRLLTKGLKKERAQSYIQSFNFEEIHNMLQRMPKPHDIFSKPILQLLQKNTVPCSKPDSMPSNVHDTQEENILDKYLKSFNRNHESTEWFQEALENTFKHFDIGKIFKK